MIIITEIWRKSGDIGILNRLHYFFPVLGLSIGGNGGNTVFATALCCSDYDDQSSHTSVIRANYVFLSETLDVKFSGLVGQLYSDHVVSAVERDDVTAEKTSFRANEKLLSALSRKSPQQFQLFLDALDNCGQRHVRNFITGRRGLPITSVFP